MSTDEDTPQHGAWFSMPFPINVDNLFAFKDQCAQSSGALRTADGDTMRASSIMGQQEALCVDSCQYDLQVASDVCEGISNDLKELTNAVSELAWAMKSVRDTYQGIAQEAQDCGLLVNGDTVSLYDESDDYLVSKFNELQEQAEVQRLNYERAEHVFSLALDSLKVDTYEQWIEPVFNALKDQFVLDDEHPDANALPYTMGLIDIGGNSVAATTMMRYRGGYTPPAGYFANGDLQAWTFRPTGTQVIEPAGTRTIAPIASKAGKIAGVAGAVVDGGITAYDTYQTDTEQHPEWSEGHKVARAGTKGVLTGAGTWGGAWLGAKGGAAIGAAVSGPFAPVGAVVGGVVGGVIGGLVGHYLGEEAGNLANDTIVDPLNES
ncbi:glycine zipper domain-containing protein [Xylanimonas cellulosilytica]|uniref:glycine zipper domain-containing protein n=1 Tax=Xylanimonas cellulosilytica TaxID=186189 RepID=UPI000AC5B741|nr:glycine zipper domain-containing protein [Xylanimonas cellulosilytica]